MSYNRTNEGSSLCKCCLRRQLTTFYVEGVFLLSAKLSSSLRMLQYLFVFFRQGVQLNCRWRKSGREVCWGTPYISLLHLLPLAGLKAYGKYALIRNNGECDSWLHVLCTCRHWKGINSANIEIVFKRDFLSYAPPYHPTFADVLSGPMQTLQMVGYNTHIRLESIHSWWNMVGIFFLWFGQWESEAWRHRCACVRTSLKSKKFLGV